MHTPSVSPPRYRIERSLGKGGLGEVFLAFDTRLRRHVALKRLSGTPTREGTPREQAWREGVHLATVQHPNVVAVYDFGTDAHGPFLIMELVGGETLDAVVARGAFPLADFLLLARQTLEGLAAAHQAGLFHRDLKPGNIMLKYSPTHALQVKIVDFGIAVPVRESERFADSRSATDQPPVILGTVEFVAPERFERHPISERGELYSLGCIFYYALTAMDAFRGATTGEIITSHLVGSPTPLDLLRDDLPPALSAWVMRLLSRQPEDRPASVQAALAEFQTISSPRVPVRWAEAATIRV